MKKDKDLNFGICKNCNSFLYCQNAERGMIKCINYNKFPKEEKK